MSIGASPLSRRSRLRRRGREYEGGKASSDERQLPVEGEMIRVKDEH